VSPTRSDAGFARTVQRPCRAAQRLAAAGGQELPVGISFFFFFFCCVIPNLAHTAHSIGQSGSAMSRYFILAFFAIGASAIDFTASPRAAPALSPWGAANATAVAVFASTAAAASGDSTSECGSTSGDLPSIPAVDLRPGSSFYYTQVGCAGLFTGITVDFSERGRVPLSTPRFSPLTPAHSPHPGDGQRRHRVPPRE
jgi:hypothetical protein